MSPAVAEVRTNINLMVEVMKSCMVKDMHFGVIPGVQKPSLFKAGAEKLMATFRLSANPVVEDLSKDGEIRFRVKVEINAKDGSFVGAGIGECSSQEEKYMWRAAVCQEEFDITDEAKRRIKFKKNYGGEVQKIMQIRCNPSDLANTILKMAKKRALVDGVLTATGASDLFSQDIEDLPAEYVESIEKKAAREEAPAKHTVKPPEQAQDAPQSTKPPETGKSWQDEADEAIKAFNGEIMPDSLDSLEIGGELAEFQAVIKSVSVRENQGKAKDKTICEYIAKDGETEVRIAKWGSQKEGTDAGALVTFLVVTRKNDFRDQKQFQCQDIVVN